MKSLIIVKPVYHINCLLHIDNDQRKVDLIPVKVVKQLQFLSMNIGFIVIIYLVTVEKFNCSFALYFYTLLLKELLISILRYK